MRSKNVTSFSSRINVTTSKIWRKKNYLLRTNNFHSFFFPWIQNKTHGCSLHITCPHTVVMGHCYNCSKSRANKQSKYYSKKPFVLFFHTRYLWFQTEAYTITSFCGALICVVFFIFLLSNNKITASPEAEKYMDFFEGDSVFPLYFFHNTWSLVHLKITICCYVGKEYYNTVVNANNMLHYFDLLMI